jgi:hypothetical protein
MAQQSEANFDLSISDPNQSEDMNIPVSDFSIHIPALPEKDPTQTDDFLDQVIIQNSQNMTNLAAAHDTRLLAKYWGDEVSEEEDFTPVVTKKMTRNRNRQAIARTYNIRQRRNR